MRHNYNEFTYSAIIFTRKEYLKSEWTIINQGIAKTDISGVCEENSIEKLVHNPDPFQNDVRFKLNFLL